MTKSDATNCMAFITRNLCLTQTNLKLWFAHLFWYRLPEISLSILLRCEIFYICYMLVILEICSDILFNVCLTVCVIQTSNKAEKQFEARDLLSGAVWSRSPFPDWTRSLSDGDQLQTHHWPVLFWSNSANWRRIHSG